MRKLIKSLFMIIVPLLIMITNNVTCQSMGLFRGDGNVQLSKRKVHIYGGQISSKTIREIQFNKTGYIVSNCMFQTKPKRNSKLIKGMLNLNKKIKYADYNKNYKLVQVGKNKVAFIHSKNVANKPIKSVSFTVDGDRCKTYESYTAIGTSGRSTQSRLQQKASTRNDGVRVVDGRVLIAIGSHFKADVGQYVDVKLKNGTIIRAIVGDWKADCDTINNHTMGYNRDVIEVIVDVKTLKRTSKVSGDMSDLCKEWKSNVSEIIRYDKYYLK